MKDDLFFNLDHGYAEGLCRGFKSGILKAADYHNLVQCETLEGINRFFLLLKIRSLFNIQIFDFIFNRLTTEIFSPTNKVL